MQGFWLGIWPLCWKAWLCCSVSLLSPLQKTTFLLAITYLKRLVDLHALSIYSSCLDFAPSKVNAFLHPRPGYVPKVPTNVAEHIILQTFCPPHF